MLPEDVLNLIYTKYYSSHVLHELLHSNKVGIFKWYNPTPLLQALGSEDKGCIQHGYTEFDELVEDHNTNLYSLYCVRDKCLNCVAFKFPCLNCHCYAFDCQIPCGIWDPNFES